MRHHLRHWQKGGLLADHMNNNENNISRKKMEQFHEDMKLYDNKKIIGDASFINYLLFQEFFFPPIKIFY